MFLAKATRDATEDNGDLFERRLFKVEILQWHGILEFSSLCLQIYHNQVHGSWMRAGVDGSRVGDICNKGVKCETDMNTLMTLLKC